MKFKQSEAHNQRVERITTLHLVVGIDIAKETHVARAVNFRGMEKGRGLSFKNDREGFECFLRWIHQLMSQYGLSERIIGLESTGHYWMALADWLMEQGIEVVLVNPLTVKRNKENYDNSQSKNDPKDAWVIADAVSRGFYSAYSPQSPYYKRLRVVVNQREYWADARANVSNRLVRWIDIYFPEFHSVFKYWDQPRSLATLKLFALPSDVKPYTAAEIIEKWKGHMRNAGGRTGLGKASELLAAAHRSVGDTQADAEARMEIKDLVADYEQLTARLEELEQHIDKLLAEDPVPVKLFSSVKGLSSLYISTIMANAGDLRRYAHGSQLLSMAGLNLAESTSGKRKGQITISKRGRRQLRKYLYLAGMSLVKHNPVFRAWHQYNVEVCRMKKQRSLFKLIGKLARILVAMAHTGEPFRAEPPLPLRSAV